MDIEYNELLTYIKNSDNEDIITYALSLKDFNDGINTIFTVNGYTLLHSICKYYQNNKHLISLLSKIFRLFPNINVNKSLNNSRIKALDLVMSNTFLKNNIRLKAFEIIIQNRGVSDNIINLVLPYINNGDYQLLDIIKIMINNNYNFNYTNNDGRTFIHHLCKYYHGFDLYELLYYTLNNSKQKLYIKDNDGNTPLHYICLNCDQDIHNIIALMLIYNADDAIENNYNHKAIDILIKYYHGSDRKKTLTLLLSLIEKKYIKKYENIIKKYNIIL